MRKRSPRSRVRIRKAFCFIARNRWVSCEPCASFAAKCPSEFFFRWSYTSYMCAFGKGFINMCRIYRIIKFPHPIANNKIRKWVVFEVVSGMFVLRINNEIYGTRSTNYYNYILMLFPRRIAEFRFISSIYHHTPYTAVEQNINCDKIFGEIIELLQSELGSIVTKYKTIAMF